MGQDVRGPHRDTLVMNGGGIGGKGITVPGGCIIFVVAIDGHVAPANCAAAECGHIVSAHVGSCHWLAVIGPPPPPPTIPPIPPPLLPQ